MARTFLDEAGGQWAVRASLGADVDRRANSAGPIAPGLWFYGTSETRYLVLNPPSLPMEDELARMQEWELNGLLGRARVLSDAEAGRGPRREVWPRATPASAGAPGSAGSISRSNESDGEAEGSAGGAAASAAARSEAASAFDDVPGSPAARIRDAQSVADLTAIAGALFREYPEGLPDDLGLAIARRRHALELEARR